MSSIYSQHWLYVAYGGELLALWKWGLQVSKTGKLLLTCGLQLVAGWFGGSVHQKGLLLTAVITPGGSLLGICSVGILADRNLFLLLLKRVPCLIIKTFPISLALFPSPHTPKFCFRLNFLISVRICVKFLSRGQMSVGSIGETKRLRSSWWVFGTLWVNLFYLTHRIMYFIACEIVLSEPVVGRYERLPILWLGSGRVNRSAAQNRKSSANRMCLSLL